MAVAAETRVQRTVARAGLIWLACLIAYCGLQTFANAISVEMQDFFLMFLPVVVTVTSIVTLKAAPAMPMSLSIGFGGLAAFVFGHAYFQFFHLVIFETLHLWRRPEGLFWNLAAVIDLLVMAGTICGMIFGGLCKLSDRRSKDHEPLSPEGAQHD